MARFPGFDVVAGAGDGGAVLAQLDLGDDMAAAQEAELAGGEVELPHAAEAFVVERGGLGAVGGEALAPVAAGVAARAVAPLPFLCSKRRRVSFPAPDCRRRCASPLTQLRLNSLRSLRLRSPLPRVERA